MHSEAPRRTSGSAISAKRRRSSVGTGSAITLPYVTPIWDYFSKETAADVDAAADESMTGNEKRNVATANCNLCKKSVSVKSMWNHLKSQHAAEYAIASQKKKNTSVGGGGGSTAPVAVATDTKVQKKMFTY